jgi:hypothetical protein
VVSVEHDAKGRTLDVGRKTRTISPALRRALEIRDRGCRFPGCGLRSTDAHHVQHWADGGQTKLSNALWLCGVHHRLVHECGWTVEWWGEGRPVFFDPWGGTLFDGRWTPPPRPEAPTHPSQPPQRPEPPQAPEQPVEALVTENRRRGVTPDGWTASALWKRPEDIPDDVYFRALEALG